MFFCIFYVFWWILMVLVLFDGFDDLRWFLVVFGGFVVVFKYWFLHSFAFCVMFWGFWWFSMVLMGFDYFIIVLMVLEGFLLFLSGFYYFMRFLLSWFLLFFCDSLIICEGFWMLLIVSASFWWDLSIFDCFLVFLMVLIDVMVFE